LKKISVFSALAYPWVIVIMAIALTIAGRQGWVKGWVFCWVSVLILFLLIFWLFFGMGISLKGLARLEAEEFAIDANKPIWRSRELPVFIRKFFRFVRTYVRWLRFRASR